jgi:hypothetical protein
MKKPLSSWFGRRPLEKSIGLASPISFRWAGLVPLMLAGVSLTSVVWSQTFTNWTAPGVEFTKIANVSEGFVYEVAIKGNYAYLAHWSEGVRIVNISNPASPVVVRDFAGGHNTVGVTVDGNALYIANWAGSWDTYEIADPENPVFVTQKLNDANSVQRTVLDGNRAYVVTTGRFYIFDVSNRTNPVEIATVNPRSEYPQSGYGVDIALRNNIAFFAFTNGRLPVFDVSNPYAPVQLRTLTNGYAWGVALVDNYLYQSSSAFGIDIFDISNLTNAIHLRRVSTGGSPYRSVVIGDRMFLPNGTAGIRIYDISNRTNLVPLVQFSPTNDWFVSLTVAGDYVYASKMSGVMDIFRFVEYPRLNIASVDPGQVKVSWSPVLPGFVLQQTENLNGDPIWGNVESGTNSPTDIPVAEGSKYFRLHKSPPGGP